MKKVLIGCIAILGLVGLSGCSMAQLESTWGTGKKVHRVLPVQSEKVKAVGAGIEVIHGTAKKVYGE